MTAKTYPNASMAPDGSQYVTLTDGSGNLVTTGNITIGTTPITGGATTQVLFNLAGVVSSDSGFTYAGSGGAVALTGILQLPDTTSATVGVIQFGGARFIHDAGSNTNVFIGRNAANTTVTGIQNVGIGGGGVLGSLSGGNNNTAMGYFALGNQAGSANSTAVGSSALSGATGSANTGVGFNAGANLGAASQNTIIGSGTGLGITTGNNNTIIGQGVTGLASGLTGAIILAIGGGTIEADFGKTTAGAWTFAAPVGVPSYTVATLPVAPGTGAIALVTDQVTAIAAKGTAPTGGGAIKEVVVYTGAGWVSI
jgi:hypothetical protein